MLDRDAVKREVKAVIDAVMQTDTQKIADIVGRMLFAEAEVESLKQDVTRLDWQNQPNRNPAVRAGFEFYINEGWSALASVAMDDVGCETATLMKHRFDPDDDRVRVRLVKDDNGLLEDLKTAEEGLDALLAMLVVLAEEEQKLLMAEIIADNIVKQEHHKGALRVLRSIQAQIYDEGAKAKLGEETK